MAVKSKKLPGPQRERGIRGRVGEAPPAGYPRAGVPIIDVHTHIFPPEIIRTREKIALRESSFALIYGNARARMVDADGLREYMATDAIDRAVITSFPFRDRGLVTSSNDYLLDVSKADERLVPFVMIGGKKGEDLPEIERCLKSGARGVGELAFYETGFGKKERKNLEGLGRYMEQKGMILMLHVNEQVGHSYTGKSRVDFGQVIDFVGAHQELKIILCHLGGGICFYEFMPEIKKNFPNVYYDLAATPYLYAPAIYRFIAEFLRDKVLFGSDYPLLPFSRYEREMTGMIGRETKEKLLYGNARCILDGLG